MTESTPDETDKKETSWAGLAGLAIGVLLIWILVGGMFLCHKWSEAPSLAYTSLERILNDAKYSDAHQLIIEAMDDDIVTWEEFNMIHDIEMRIDLNANKISLRNAIDAKALS